MAKNMDRQSPQNLGRRQLLKQLSLAAAAGPASALWSRRAGAQTTAKPRFLIVIAGAGGASIIDSLLAIPASTAGASAARINTFPDAQVQSIADSPFRAVDLQFSRVGAIPIPFSSNQSNFVRKHKDELMVVTQTGTSVNHTVAQKRSLTGNDAWNGRTLQEAVAAQYGAQMLVPNVNMATGGYIEPGIDASLPAFARHEPVAEPFLWPLSLDAAKGLKDTPKRSRLDLARRVRDEHLEPESPFFRTFAQSQRLALWRAQRSAARNLESQDLITRLNVLPNIPNSVPLNEFGLAESPDGARVRQAFPDYLTDPFEAQAALAFLLIKYRVSCAVTISPSFNVLLKFTPPEVTNPPLAFDFSHQNHRAGQAVMWHRILSVADRLSDLLRSEPFEDGESLWDRSLIYFATEFGRTRRRPDNAADFGSGHDLNNGYVVMSPMANGNKVLGGVEPTTGLTFGFAPEDPRGTPIPNRTMQEREIYAGLLHTMRVDTSGSSLPDMRAMRKTA